jgi:hypothetical protein
MMPKRKGIRINPNLAKLSDARLEERADFSALFSFSGKS